MSVTLPLDKMSIEEKIQVMESIWEDLCKSADGMTSPPWHENILKEREERVKRKEDEFIDWGKAKNNIKNDLS